jgi:hypothetical protein
VVETKKFGQKFNRESNTASKVIVKLSTPSSFLVDGFYSKPMLTKGTTQVSAKSLYITRTKEELGMTFIRKKKKEKLN